MADTATNTKSYTWLWWVLGITGIAAVGTTVWYFFFRKDSKYAQDQVKKREQNDQNGSSSQGNGSQGSNSQGSSNSTSIENVEQPPHIIMPPKTNVSPPKTNPSPKVGNVYDEIFLKYRETAITNAPKNAAALVQYLINDLIANYKIDLPKLVVDGVFGNKSKTAFNAVMNKLYNKTGVIYSPASFTVGMFVNKYASSKNVFLNASEEDIKALIDKVVPEKVFIIK